MSWPRRHELIDVDLDAYEGEEAAPASGSRAARNPCNSKRLRSVEFQRSKPPNAPAYRSRSCCQSSADDVMVSRRVRTLLRSFPNSVLKTATLDGIGVRRVPFICYNDL
jgi:hypothetical protein